MIVNVIEVRALPPTLQLVAEDIARQLENRVTFRRAMKQCMRNAAQAPRSFYRSRKGIKAMCSPAVWAALPISLVPRLS